MISCAKSGLRKAKKKKKKKKQRKFFFFLEGFGIKEKEKTTKLQIIQISNQPLIIFTIKKQKI